MVILFAKKKKNTFTLYIFLILFLLTMICSEILYYNSLNDHKKAEEFYSSAYFGMLGGRLIVGFNPLADVLFDKVIKLFQASGKGSNHILLFSFWKLPIKVKQLHFISG